MLISDLSIATAALQRLPVHPDLGVVEDGKKWKIVCPDDMIADVAASVAAVSDIGALRADAKARVIIFADGITSRITDRYPAAEVASWPTREAEARAVLAGATADATPLITALAQAEQATRDLVATAIMAKASQYRAIVVAVSTIRAKAEAALDQCQTAAQISVALKTVQAAALAAAVELGLA